MDNVTFSKTVAKIFFTKPEPYMLLYVVCNTLRDFYFEEKKI